MRNILILSLGMFALGFDAYIIAGLLPGISETYTISTSQVGLAVSIFTLFYALSAPIFSSLFAGKSIKKTLLYSMIIFTIANSLTAMAPTFTILLISRAISGAAAGLFSPLAIAASPALVSSAKKGRALGFTLGGMSIGTVLGVPLGLYVSSIFNWQASIWLLVLIGLLAILGILVYFPTIETPAPPALYERLKMFLDKRVTITVFITFFASISSLGLYTYLSPLINELTGTNNLMIYLWTWGVGGLVGSLTIGTLIDHVNNTKTLVTITLTILTLSIICIPIMIHIPLLKYLPFFVWGATGWASQAPQQHLLMNYQPTNGSSAVALNSSLNYLGSSVGATLGGFLLAFSSNATFLVFFAFGAMMISISLQLYSVKNFKLSK